MTSSPFCHICDCRVDCWDIYAKRASWTYVRCPDCSLVLLHPVPEEDTLRSYYNRTYEVNLAKHVKDCQRGAAAVLADLKERFPKRGRLLEVGCSYGAFLSEARRDGWDVTGIELSETAARHAREYRGLRVLSGQLTDHVEQLGDKFDAVVLFHVIEHVPNPVQLLQMCRRITKPHGLLILKTPNVASLIARATGSSWQWLTAPAHLCLYSPRSMERLLQRAGYDLQYYRSAQGDANNHFFAVLSSAARRVLCKTDKSFSSSLRQSLGVKIAEAICEFLYSPLGLLLDPWLGRKLLQPELYAVASKSA